MWLHHSVLSIYSLHWIFSHFSKCDTAEIVPFPPVCYFVPCSEWTTLNHVYTQHVSPKYHTNKVNFKPSKIPNHLNDRTYESKQRDKQLGRKINKIFLGQMIHFMFKCICEVSFFSYNFTLIHWSTGNTARQHSSEPEKTTKRQKRI